MTALLDPPRRDRPPSGPHPTAAGAARAVPVPRRGGAWSQPRALHPLAWWAWALGLAAAATRTTNPILLILLVAVVAWVVLERREPGGSRILLGFLVAGGIALALRLAMMVVFGGGADSGAVVLSLPEIPLPGWAGRLRIGGDVTSGALAVAGVEALRLAAVLSCVGAANALAGPRRLLRYVPATLYDVGTALVVALSYAPALVDDAARVRAGRRLRGHSGRGLGEAGRMALPVAAGALERSLALAASMESRGYGRAGRLGVRRQQVATAVTLAGVVGALVGAYGLLDGASSPLLGLPLLVGGTGSALAALLLAGRGDRRSHYRRDPWAGPEWLVLALGLVPPLALTLGAAHGWAGIAEPPPAAIALPLPPVLVVLAAGLAGVLTPPRHDGPEQREGAA